MAYPTTDMRVEPGTLGLFTEGCHLDAWLKTSGKRPAYLCPQAHKLTGVGPVNGWHRACAAKRGLPSRADQAAFFTFAAAIIIPKEIFTFRSGRSFHIVEFPKIDLNGKSYL